MLLKLNENVSYFCEITEKMLKRLYIFRTFQKCYLNFKFLVVLAENILHFHTISQYIFLSERQKHVLIHFSCPNITPACSDIGGKLHYKKLESA